MNENTSRLLWSSHHLLLDGWALPMLLDEALALYDAARGGPAPELPERPPYRDYVAWLARRDASADEPFWRRALAGVRGPTPLGIGRPARAPGPHESREARLDGATTAALTALGRSRHLTLNTIVQGAWAVLLSRYAGRADVVFGVTVSGRPPELPGVDRMIGLFINTLPLRAVVDEDAPLESWLLDLQARNVAMRSHEATTAARIQRWTDVPRGQPLFESILVFENLPVAAGLDRRARGLGLGRVRFHERTNFPLALSVVPGPELLLRADFDAARFDRDEIDRLLAHLATILRGIAEGRGRAIRDLPMIPEGADGPGIVGEGASPLVPGLDGLSEEELDALIDELT